MSNRFPQIVILPIERQRFTTLGDWYETDPGEFVITITEMGNWRFMFLVLMHELVEWAICQRDGVSTAACDRFDEMWEEEIKAGLHSPMTEAGFDRRCPYRKGHVWGARAERFFIWLLGADWKEYCAACDQLLLEYDGLKSRFVHDGLKSRFVQ